MAKTRPLDNPPIQLSELFDPTRCGPPLPFCDPFLPYAASRHGLDYVVKRSRDQDLTEAFNILLVQSMTTIPVPTIRQVVVSQSKVYMVMDHIKGETLAECWSHLSWWSRLNVVWTLRGYMSQLRQLQRSTPGPVVRTPSEGHFFTEYGAGPFNSYEEMVDWFNHKLDVAQKKSKAPRNAPRWDCSWPLVFVHNDLNMRNVLLGEDGQVYLLDWARSGFYPAWFEYASMRHERWQQPRSWTFFNPIIAGKGFEFGCLCSVLTLSQAFTKG
jgi:aminoglycoside phosphotransferase (APT) family kinase protein